MPDWEALLKARGIKAPDEEIRSLSQRLEALITALEKQTSTLHWSDEPDLSFDPSPELTSEGSK
jgi:hypothetical protein